MLQNFQQRIAARLPLQKYHARSLDGSGFCPSVLRHPAFVLLDSPVISSSDRHPSPLDVVEDPRGNAHPERQMVPRCAFVQVAATLPLDSPSIPESELQHTFSLLGFHSGDLSKAVLEGHRENGSYGNLTCECFCIPSDTRDRAAV